jgi:hypothetical protein
MTSARQFNPLDTRKPRDLRYLAIRASAILRRGSLRSCMLQYAQVIVVLVQAHDAVVGNVAEQHHLPNPQE